MLSFTSASVPTVDTPSAIAGAIEAASAGRDPGECRAVFFHVSMGHDDSALLSGIRTLCPNARILGCTCAGVIGREGANESMRALAVMMVWGDASDLEMSVSAELNGANARAEARALGEALQARRGTPRCVMFIGSGIDIACDEVLKGIADALGPAVTVFGGTSADNMKGIASYQFIDGERYEHAAALVGFFDPTLDVVTQASHGFVASGTTMTVTAATGNRVHEIDGEPAWQAYTHYLGLPASATPGDTIPPGAVGVALSPKVAAEYGDSHLLRVITHRDSDGSFLMPVTCDTGTELMLMRRDEERIFRNLDTMMDQIRTAMGQREVVAVFHADCGARGRLTLDRVAKDEIVKAMQTPLQKEGLTPPWLGMYGFGELARLDGQNQFHNYTTALYVLVR